MSTSKSKELLSAEQCMMEISIKLNEMKNDISVMREKQEEMSEDIAKIKEAVYNPDIGLYARIRNLETWKSTSTKMMWILFTSFVGVIGAVILNKLT